MAHIFMGYLVVGLTAVLGRRPTQEEIKTAISAIENDFGSDIFTVFK